MSRPTPAISAPTLPAAPDGWAAYKDFLKEFIYETDRAAVVLGAAYLDDLLRRLVEARAVLASGAASSMLHGTADKLALRVRIAHALGAIGDSEAQDVLAVAKIRNVFAHEGPGTDFTHKDVEKAARQVRILRSVFGPAAATFDPKPRIRFDTTVALLSVALTRRLQSTARLPEAGPAPL